jgi:hypothetical protein
MYVVLLAALSLPVGFAVADATGNRPLGGIVLGLLAFGALVAARRSDRRAAWWLAILVGSFAASHALAGVVGTWGAVFLAAAVTTAGAAVLLARPER